MGRSFNGSSNYLGCGAGSPIPTQLTQMSISFWLKTSSTGTVEIVSRNYTVWEVQLTSNSIALYVNGSSVSPLGVNVVNNNVWRHVLLTYDSGANQTKGYLDGLLKATVAAGAMPSSANGMEIGRRLADSEYFAGDLAELAFWDRILTAPELANMAAGQLAFAYPTGLLGYWPLLGDDSPEPDASAGGNDATVNGATKSATHPPMFVAEVPFVPGADYELQNLNRANLLSLSDVVFVLQDPTGDPAPKHATLAQIKALFGL